MNHAVWLLVLFSVALGQDSSSTFGCWNHYCEYQYETMHDYIYKKKAVNTLWMVCQRPHNLCGVKYLDDKYNEPEMTCTPNTENNLPVPDVYCTSSELRDCKCGLRASDRHDIQGGDRIEAFCDCEPTELAVGNKEMVLTCVLVPLFLVIVSVCVWKVCGESMRSIVSSTFSSVSGKTAAPKKEQEIVTNKTVTEGEGKEGERVVCGDVEAQQI